MTGWLKLTDDQRRATIANLEYISGIRAKAIEKDWWVTLTLKALFNGKYAKEIVFKGGTSLSKCWNLIQRFSEDIDIALSPEAFGMAYTKDPSKNYVSNLKKKGCEFTSTSLKTDLEGQFLTLGIPKGLLTVLPDPVRADMPDKDPQILHIQYPSLYPPHTYIADEVKVEVSVRSLQFPHGPAEMMSMLGKEILTDEFKETPFTIQAVKPHKTFLEKIFLLHEEFCKADPTKIRSDRMSRHLYDLSTMMDTQVEADALADHALYEELIKHRESYSRISWVDYTTLSHLTVAFIPPDEVRELYQRDYQTMREEMIYGESKSFEEIIARLEALQIKVRSKKNPK